MKNRYHSVYNETKYKVQYPAKIEIKIKQMLNDMHMILLLFLLDVKLWFLWSRVIYLTTSFMVTTL